ncbi:NAD(P)H-dependent oxidoreductase [soil metagenome]
MTRLMIIVGSVRPGRVGLAVAEWVRAQVTGSSDFDIDFVDLAELALPFMDEPKHPRLREYTKPHTLAWSERVDAADAFILVSPEYNHSYSPALKNALDFLNQEWWRKPVGIVSYGGASGGTRGAAALTIVTSGLGLVKLGANIEINFVANQIADGVFTPNEKEVAILDRMIAEIGPLSKALAPLR